MTNYKNELLRVVTHFFNHLGGVAPLLPTDCEVFIGKHKPANTNIPLFQDAARAKHLGTVATHHLIYDSRPIKLIQDTIPYRWDATDAFSGDMEPFLRQALLDLVIIRGDLVWDDQSGLADAGIGYTEKIDELSRMVRLRNFGRSFSDIIAPEGVDPRLTAGFFGNIAANATYDKDGKYYPKYKDLSPEDKGQRQFVPAKLSDRYISLNYAEVIPAGNKPHVMFRLGDKRAVFELSTDKRLEVAWQPILISGFPPGVDDIWEHFLFLNTADNPLQAIFFGSSAGPKKFTPPEFPIVRSETNRATDERVFDPRIWVKQQWEETEDRFTDEWDWFVAMMEMRFGSQIYEVLVNESETHTLNRKELVFAPLNEALKDSTGEFRKHLTNALKRAKRDPKVNYFLQGMPLEASGNRRFMGSDSTKAYVRRLDSGLTTTIPINIFITDLKIANVFGDVYNRTKHLIPIIAVFLTIATAGIFLPVLGAGLMWAGFVWLVKDQVLNLATKQVTKRMIERFRRQLQFLLVDTLVSLFPRSNMKGLEFVRGFLRGFARDAIESLLTKYKTVVLEGPSAYRWYKLFNRIQASLNKIQAKIDELKGVIDTAAGRLLVDRFVEIGARGQTSAVLLFSNVYFLDYESAKGPIETFAALSGTKPISQTNWEKARALRLQSLLVAYSKPLREAKLESIKSGTALAASSLRIGIKSVSIAQDFLLLTKISGHFGIVAIVGGVGGLAGGVTADIAKNEGKVTLTTLKLLSKGPVAFVKGHYSGREMYKLGQLVGHAIGGFFLNGAIFAEGTKLGRLKEPDNKKGKSREQKVKEKAISSFVSSEFGHGSAMPIIKLVLSHYLILLNRLKVANKDVWEKAEQRIQKLLYGKSSFQEFQALGKQPISFGKAKTIVKLLDDILLEQLDALIKDPGLDKELERAANYLKRAKAPNWNDLIDGKAPSEFSQRAIAFAAIAHLQSVLSELTDLINLILDPVRTAKGHEVSINDVLALLGITTTAEEAHKENSQRLMSVFGDKEQQKQSGVNSNK